MAIVRNLWLRGVSKKLAGSVYFQAKGRTLQRELAPLVTNPRTPAQMATRVRLANLVQLYKAGRGWMKASFEYKKQTQSDYNAFVSANLANANVYLTKQQVASGAGVVAPVVITKGSLPPVVLTEQDGILKSDLLVGELASEVPTVADISAALINNNVGLQAGDQISIVQYVQQTGQDGTPYVVCRAYEMILDTASTASMYDFLPDFVTVAGDSIDDGVLTINEEAPMGGYAFIVSRTVGSTLPLYTFSMIIGTVSMVVGLTIFIAFIRRDATGGLGR